MRKSTIPFSSRGCAEEIATPWKGSSLFIFPGNHINDCLEGVSHKQRMAFVLREVESMETSAICEILGITASTFGVLIHRARSHLRDCLEAKGIGR